MIQGLGWTATLVLVIGLWLVGSKKRVCFVYTIIGETLWVLYALLLKPKSYPLAVTCSIFIFLAARNWFKWGQNPE